MKILFTLNSGNQGGMEQHVLDLISGLHARGHELYVWCQEGIIVDWYKSAGAQVFTHKIGFDIDPSYIYALIQFLKDHKIDVLHAHELKAVTNSLIAGLLAGTKVRISHTHTPISEWQIEGYKKAFDFIKTFGYAMLVRLFGDVEIALTESRKNTKHKEGIPEDKLYIIPNAISDSVLQSAGLPKSTKKNEYHQRFNIPTGSFVFGCVGRITREKGHDILVDAYAKFTKKLVATDKTFLLIAGGGALEDPIKSKLKELGLEASSYVTGFFDKADQPTIYSALDVFVFPSRAEGFGIVLIEALANGLPAICSDLPVLQEVGGSMCFYFESENADDLAQKMFDLYSKRDKLDNLKNGGRERVLALYTMDKFITAYEDLYSGILETKK